MRVTLTSCPFAVHRNIFSVDNIAVSESRDLENFILWRSWVFWLIVNVQVFYTEGTWYLLAKLYSSVLELSSTCEGTAKWLMQGKVISCIKPLLYLGKNRQASGHVSLTSESVFKAKRKVERNGSGLTGAVNQIIWAQQFLTAAGRKHIAYWEGESSEGGRCWDGAPFLTPRSSFPTARTYPEAPYIIVLQVLRSMPNKNKEGKISGPFSPCGYSREITCQWHFRSL